jgi:hypothetical protein
MKKFNKIVLIKLILKKYIKRINYLIVKTKIFIQLRNYLTKFIKEK